MPTDIWKARVERRGKDLLVPSLIVIALLGAGVTARAETITVAPIAKGGEGMTIQQALDKAQPGDTIMLAPGTYLQDLRSVRDGQQGRPIVIKGSRSSIVSGGGQPRVIEINHSYIELRGFTVDGHFEAANTKDSYRDKLIYVIGNQPGRGPNGLKILNMDIRNAGGECVRMRYQARNNEIANSRITSCGHADFKFKDGGKNGEGIYIGTAPNSSDSAAPPIARSITPTTTISTTTSSTQPATSASTSRKAQAATSSNATAARARRIGNPAASIPGATPTSSETTRCSTFAARACASAATARKTA